jgi:AcrR family transcriptional regulator
MSLAARRERIMEAAQEIFARNGYHGASMGEIARHAGITKATLYDHFASKEDLHLSLLRQQRDELLAHVSGPLTADGTAEQRVTDAIDAFFSYVQQHPYTWRMLFRDTTGEPRVVDEHRRLQSEANSAIVGILLRTAPAASPLARQTKQQQEILAEVLGGAANGLARWWYDHPRVPRRRLVATLTQIVWHGLAAQTSSSHAPASGNLGLPCIPSPVGDDFAPRRTSKG